MKYDVRIKIELECDENDDAEELIEDIVTVVSNQPYVKDAFHHMYRKLPKNNKDIME